MPFKIDEEQREKAFVDSFNNVLEELHGESERACAIIGAAYLDNLLGEILKIYLLENVDAENELISPDSFGVLGNFASRIKMSYGIGLINIEHKKALNLIRRIRNRFAHDIKLKFDDQEISKLCKQLQKLVPEISYPSSPPSPREVYQSVIAYLSGRNSEMIYLLNKFDISGSFSAVFS